jgi:hypothetical protein
MGKWVQLISQQPTPVMANIDPDCTTESQLYHGHHHVFMGKWVQLMSQ